MKTEKISPLISANEIKKTVKKLAEKISFDFKEEPLVLIGILKGSFIFLADLSREIKNPVQIDFIRIRSYGSSRESCGVVEITKDLELDLKGKNVIIVEDILDSGCSLSFLLKHLRKMKPKVLKTCVLVKKDIKRSSKIKINYLGLNVPDLFLVGYGLDFDERHRNKKGIYSIKFK